LLDFEADSEQPSQPGLMLLSYYLNFSGRALNMVRFSIEILFVRKKIHLAKMAHAAVKHPFSGFGRVLAPI
jgi:CII-binding regulator of phage lambda lysogenization HflD